MDILVKQDFSAADIKRAEVARAEFRPSPATSRATNVLDTADTYGTVLMCDDHVRQFADPRVLRQYGYRQMVDLPTGPYVIGRCDYCGDHGRCSIFTHESIFPEVWRTKDERRRDYATATVVR